MLAALRPMKNLIWRGDGRFDSMGHNAKYGIYSMYYSSNSKIVHFELLQVVTGFWCLNTYQGENLIRCLYSFCNKLVIIFNFYFCPQANEAGTSNAMELLGAKKFFERLQKENIDVSVFVSDRL